MKARRTFTKEFKLSIIRELETKSTAQISKEHNVHPMLISKWKKDYERNPHGAFSGKGNVWKEEAKVAQYERLIGQLFAENSFLKKTSTILQEKMAEEKKRWAK